MFFPEGRVRIFVYGEPVNMRLSFDGLYALVRHTMQLDALDGNLYAFINRRGTQMRVLYWDRSGFCVWAKRLETGRLISDWSAVRTREVDWTQLKCLLEGIEPKRVRKRYKHAPKETDSAVRNGGQYIRMKADRTHRLARLTQLGRRREDASAVYTKLLEKARTDYPTPDNSKLDWIVSVNLARQGFTADEIETAILNSSPDLSLRKVGHEQDYARRTAGKAVATNFPKPSAAPSDLAETESSELQAKRSSSFKP